MIVRARGTASTGFVSLVGAGPGDPDLLTRRALDRLTRADLVLNDALVPADLLELAPRAQRFFVGKRAGRHSIDQSGIHALMIRAAHRGQRVVRLKCGDPFVLGRGGEEGLALTAAHVPLEVVPGLSSATAAPALAGIPVTHRGISAGFVVVSGHAPEAYQPILEGLAPAVATVVVLMGVRSRGELAEYLIGRGWPGTTPAALVLSASHASQAAWIGCLATLGAAPIRDTDAPGVLVIGEVVSLASTLASALPDAPVAISTSRGPHVRHA
jgi:uroporphyrin-III C-methyltransferase/precorrin-2 dehydrogenase/sirohydrochlorin ferrochelatase